MASSKRRLRLGRRAVDFIRQHDIAEDGAANECPAPMAGGGILLDDVGAGDVGGHQVRGELDAPELQTQRLRDGADHQRLGGPGQAGDQAMAADKQSDEDLLEHFVLADDDLAHLLHDAVAHRVEALDTLLQVGRNSTRWQRFMRSFLSRTS